MMRGDGARRLPPWNFVFPIGNGLERDLTPEAPEPMLQAYANREQWGFQASESESLQKWTQSSDPNSGASQLRHRQHRETGGYLDHSARVRCRVGGLLR